MNKIPIESAKEYAEKHGQQIAVTITWERDTGVTHVVTYGENQQECDWACDLGNQIKRSVLKWPEEMCNAEPERLNKDHDEKAQD
jgi:hypothetical protein